MNILFIGYGDIAQRTARVLLEQGHQVTGMCRTPDSKPPINDVSLVSGDAGNEQDLKQVLQPDPSTGKGFDVIVITLTPTEYSAEGYRQGYVVPCRHLQQVLHHQAVNAADESPYVIYVSSTGVYGQQQGEWVDEDSATEPTTDSGSMLLQAEQLIRDLPMATTVMRCSGIYGEGRDFMIRLLQQHKATLRRSWSNRIHQDDVARAIAFFVKHPKQRLPLVLMNDDEPVQQFKVYQWLAEQLHLEVPNEISDEASPRGSKRCSNARLKATGFNLLYPSYRDGYRPMIKAASD